MLWHCEIHAPQLVILEPAGSLFFTFRCAYVSRFLIFILDSCNFYNIFIGVSNFYRFFIQFGFEFGFAHFARQASDQFLNVFIVGP